MRGPRAFTLIEMLLVVVLVGILAAIVVPRMANAKGETIDAAVRRHLQIVRYQLEVYRAREGADPDLIGNGWLDMLNGDYLLHPPVNPFNGRTDIVADAADGPAGWVWRDKGNGTNWLYATNSTGLGEYIE